MTCDRYREAISALVDGEDAGIDPQRVEAHVAGCADCAEYRATAEAVRRQLRVATAVPAPDASRRIARLAAAADRSTSRRAVRLVLVVVAVEIMVLSVVDLITVDGDADAVHGTRHLSAFTIAYAVLLLVVAARPARARTALPVAAVLAGALAITAVVDLASGRIPLLGEALHIPEIASVALIWMLASITPRARTSRPVGTKLRLVTLDRDAN